MKQTSLMITRKYIGKIMMEYFKSLWLKLRKSNGMPGNTVLIPMVEQKVPETIEKPVKVRKPRKKKEITDVTN
jgi:hypothetical protein